MFEASFRKGDSCWQAPATRASSSRVDGAVIVILFDLVFPLKRPKKRDKKRLGCSRIESNFADQVGLGRVG